jgi:hypothetical protein
MIFSSGGSNELSGVTAAKHFSGVNNCFTGIATGWMFIMYIETSVTQSLDLAAVSLTIGFTLGSRAIKCNVS